MYAHYNVPTRWLAAIRTEVYSDLVADKQTNPLYPEDELIWTVDNVAGRNYWSDGVNWFRLTRAALMRRTSKVVQGGIPLDIFHQIG